MSILLRIAEGTQLDQVRDRVEIDGIGLSTKTQRLERNTATSGKQIKDTRNIRYCSSTVGWCIIGIILSTFTCMLQLDLLSCRLQIGWSRLMHTDLLQQVEICLTLRRQRPEHSGTRRHQGTASPPRVQTCDMSSSSRSLPRALIWIDEILSTTAHIVHHLDAISLNANVIRQP